MTKRSMCSCSLPYALKNIFFGYQLLVALQLGSLILLSFDHSVNLIRNFFNQLRVDKTTTTNKVYFLSFETLAFYTTFIMAARSGGVVTNRIRARQVRPRYQKQRHDAYSFLSKMSSGSFLEERDIPGASLCGRKPSELKNEEHKFWLRCKGDPGKGLKPKPNL